MATRRKAKTQRRNSGNDRVTDSDVNAAVSIIKRDYYQDVSDLGDSIKDEVKAGDIEDEEAMMDRIREDVDSSARVIYTFQAKLGLLSSDNEDEWENVGLENPTPEQKMFCAMEADVIEYIGDFDDIAEEEEE